jgi:hypothetical protein
LFQKQPITLDNVKLAKLFYENGRSMKQVLQFGFSFSTIPPGKWSLRHIASEPANTLPTCSITSTSPHKAIALARIVPPSDSVDRSDTLAVIVKIGECWFLNNRFSVDGYWRYEIARPG